MFASFSNFSTFMDDNGLFTIEKCILTIKQEINNSLELICCGNGNQFDELIFRISRLLYNSITSSYFLQLDKVPKNVETVAELYKTAKVDVNGKTELLFINCDTGYQLNLTISAIVKDTVDLQLKESIQSQYCSIQKLTLFQAASVATAVLYRITTAEYGLTSMTLNTVQQLIAGDPHKQVSDKSNSEQPGIPVPKDLVITVNPVDPVEEDSSGENTTIGQHIKDASNLEWPDFLKKKSIKTNSKKRKYTDDSPYKYKSTLRAFTDTLSNSSKRTIRHTYNKDNAIPGLDQFEE